jgi:fatty-acyl-CoA synthase
MNHADPSLSDAVLNESYCHRGGNVPLRGETIPAFIKKVVDCFPDNEAVVSVHQGIRLNYRELWLKADELACGLVALGFGKGDRIGIWSTNNIEWLTLQLATARVGAILVNINPAYRVRELAYALQRSEVQAIFTIPAFRSSDYVSMFGELLPELATSDPDQFTSAEFPQLRRVILFDPSSPMKTDRPSPGFTTWQEVIQLATTVEQPQLDQLMPGLDRDDPINIQYTSGTTGFPKAVLLSHHNILNNAWFTARGMHFSERDRLCVTVPFYHCFGMVLANLLTLSVGGCLVLPGEYFDPLATLRAIQDERCTALHGVPTMFIAELDHPEFACFDLSTLRTGIMAGAPCPPALMKRVIEDMHCREILIGYGETEASPLTHLTSRDDSVERRLETVGTNLPHQEVKVVDIDSGQTVPIGEIGEICFRGYHIMPGYYDDAEATAGAIDGNGWLFSGDLGSMDESGYLRITGRRKEMIIRGGENIYPREIEDCLFMHPKVAEAAVFGIPDDYYGEEVMAWIKLREGESVDEEEIRSYCKERLAHFKVPRRIWFVDDFPMTVTGKLQKFRMREMAMKKSRKRQANKTV